MSYLRYSDASALIERYPTAFGPREARLVGADKSFDSGYHSIVRFFGDAAIDPAAVRLHRKPGRYQIDDPLVREFAKHVANDLRSAGRLYDGPAVAGLRSPAPDTSSSGLDIQETSYPDFAGSCFALDLAYPAFSKYGGTLRDYYMTECQNIPLGQRPLANCFGVSGYVLVADSEQRLLLQVVRSAHLATMAGTPGPSVAGSVDFSVDHQTLGDMTSSHMGTEVQEELALQTDEFSVIPLAFAREIIRGDNPQLFCLITVHLPPAELESRMMSIPSAEREFADYQFYEIGENCRLSQERVAGLNFEARMNYYLVEEYLSLVG